MAAEMLRRPVAYGFAPIRETLNTGASIQRRLNIVGGIQADGPVAAGVDRSGLKGSWRLSTAGPGCFLGLLLSGPCRRQRRRSRGSSGLLGLLGLRGLNPQQAEAAAAPGGAHIVVAGAGTGKTKTLVERLVHLVDEGVDPGRIVLLTFTNAAAEDMRHRAGMRLGQQNLSVRAGTFHGFCLGLLTKYATRLGFPSGISVLDEADAVSLLRKARNLHGKKSRLPPANELKRYFSSSVNRDVPLASVCPASQFSQLDDIEAVHRRYVSQKRAQNAMDFDDFLVFCDDLLREDEEVRVAEAQKCEHLLVDEYQDTNHLQASICRHLTSVHGNIMAVGDDAQSIYGFRGARIGNMWDFSETFASGPPILLEENYRSTQQILDLANAVLLQSKSCIRKELRSNCSAGVRPLLLRLPGERSEAAWVAEEIQKLCEAGTSLESVAVLYRKNKQSKPLEAELRTRELLFRTSGGGPRLMARAHVKDLLAVLDVAVREASDHWLRVLTLLPAIGSTTALKIVDSILPQQPPRLDLECWKGRKFYEDLRKLTELLAAVRRKESDPAACVGLARRWYEPYLAAKHDNDRERMADLESLEAEAEAMQSASLHDFLNTIRVNDMLAKKKDPKLTLSTVHSAKGLEWEHVFIIGVGKNFDAMSMFGEDLEDVRRLFYVAITRAKRTLRLTCPEPLLTPLLDVPRLRELVRASPEEE